MSNFTQGPWVAKGGEVCTEEYEADGMIMHDHICCCEVINGESANAKLIAAAPELFEALQGVMSMFPVIDDDKSGRLGFTAEARDKLYAANAAITKALGQ